MEINVRKIINVNDDIHKVHISYTCWKFVSDDETFYDRNLEFILTLVLNLAGFTIVETHKQEGINYDMYYITFAKVL